MASRRYKTIERWLFEEINPADPSSVKYNDRVSKYFGNSPQAVIAFIAKLNAASKFTPDNLQLLPGDVPPDPFVRQLLAAIVDDYMRRGWTVT